MLSWYFSASFVAWTLMLLQECVFFGQFFGQFLKGDVEMSIYGLKVYLIILHTCDYWVDPSQHLYARNCEVSLKDKVFCYSLSNICSGTI